MVAADRLLLPSVAEQLLVTPIGRILRADVTGQLDPRSVGSRRLLEAGQGPPAATTLARVEMVA